MGDNTASLDIRQSFGDGEAFGFFHEMPRQLVLMFIGQGRDSGHGLLHELGHALILGIVERDDKDKPCRLWSHRSHSRSALTRPRWSDTMRLFTRSKRVCASV